MPSDDDDVRVFQQIVSGFDTPAFLRRARRVEDAWNTLLERCRRHRHDWLEGPRLRLATLVAVTGDWGVIERLFGDPADGTYLHKLFADWQPKLRLPIAPTRSVRKIRTAGRHLEASFARFNRRWERFVSELDLNEVNDLRAGYNKYYVLEKECMVRSARVAREGFRPLTPATLDDILLEFPLLKILKMSD